MTTAAKNHYDVLGAPRTASHAELRRAYIGLARRFHPDFHVDDTPALKQSAAARMRRINDAWSVVGDASKRAAYDRAMGFPGPAPVPTAGDAPTTTPGAAAATATSAHGMTAGSGHGPEPSSGHRPSRVVQMLPAMLLVSALMCFSIGLVTQLSGLLAVGLGCAILGGASFVLLPMLTAARSRNESPA